MNAWFKFHRSSPQRKRIDFWNLKEKENVILYCKEWNSYSGKINFVVVSVTTWAKSN